MAKQTTVSFIITTDDQGDRQVTHRVYIVNGDQFPSEEDKEESTASDINFLFDRIDQGKVSRKIFFT